MKKPYTRPGIFFESTETNPSPSSACEAIANLAENACTITVENPYLPGVKETLFATPGVCVPTTDGDAFCYHAPTEWNNVYSS